MNNFPAPLFNYCKALYEHDWTYEFSDDHSVWQRGRASLGELQQLQPKIDPDFVIWNKFAPSDFQRKLQAPAPAPATATGDTNGRRDGLRSAVHGRVAVGGNTPGALADLLWASHDVMSLNAELGLTMDQLVRLTQTVLTAVPCAAVGDALAVLVEAIHQWRASDADDTEACVRMWSTVQPIIEAHPQAPAVAHQPETAMPADNTFNTAFLKLQEISAEAGAVKGYWPGDSDRIERVVKLANEVIEVLMQAPSGDFTHEQYIALINPSALKPLKAGFEPPESVELSRPPVQGSEA